MREELRSWRCSNGSHAVVPAGSPASTCSHMSPPSQWTESALPRNRLWPTAQNTVLFIIDSAAAKKWNCDLCQRSPVCVPPTWSWKICLRNIFEWWSGVSAEPLHLCIQLAAMLEAFHHRGQDGWCQSSMTARDTVWEYQKILFRDEINWCNHDDATDGDVSAPLNSSTQTLMWSF